MTTSTFAEAKNLGKLDLKDEKIYVIALPTASKSIVVNYSSQNLQISCTLPAKTHKVVVGDSWDKSKHKGRLNVKAPPLLIAAKYLDIPKHNRLPLNGFFIYGLNTKEKERIWAAPYMISNVYSTGKICFGGFVPQNLRSAYNLFWTTPFNSELIEQSSRWINNNSLAMEAIEDNDAEDFIKRYRKSVYDKQDWIDYTDEVCGTKYWASPRGANGVLVSTNKTLLKKIPKTYWRKCGNYPIFIARATKLKKLWSFYSGSIKFTIPCENVVLKVEDSCRDPEALY